MRKADTAARLGGDEFVILAEGLGDEADAATIARKALESIGRPVNIDDGLVEITGSIGISVYPQDDLNVERLLALADAAMYRAKRSRGERVMLSGGGAQTAARRRRRADGAALLGRGKVASRTGMLRRTAGP